MAQPSNSNPRQRPLLVLAGPLGIFLIALFVRMIYYLECSQTPWFGWPILDSRYLLAQANLLASGNGLGGPLFRPPLYTLFLGLICTFAGDSTAIIAAFLQHLIGAGYCAIVCATGQLCFSRRAGFIGGLIAAFYAPMVFYEGEIVSDSLALFFCGVFLLLWLKAIKSRNAFGFVLTGIAAGLGTITRPNLVLVAGVFLFVYAIRTVSSARLREEKRRRFRQCGAFVLPLIAVAMIPSVYNAAQGDYNFICSQGGINFWLGNNAESNGANIVIPKVVEPSSDYIDTVEHFALYDYNVAMTRKPGVGESPPPSAISSFWYRRGFDFLASDPSRAARLYAKKIVALINNYEVRNNKDFFFVRKHLSRVLRYLPITFGCLFALACAGIWAGFTHPMKGPLRWILLFEAVMGAGIIMYFVGGRLRLPFVAGLFPLAGLAIDRTVYFFWERDWKRLVLMGLIGFLAAALSFNAWRIFDFRVSDKQPQGLGIYATSYYPEEYALVATSCVDAGRYAIAAQYAAAAIKGDAGFGYPNLVAGIADLNLGDVDNAARHFRRALELEPNSTRALNNMSVVAEKKGQYQAAAELLSWSLEVNPDDAVAQANLAMLHFRSGNKDNARVLAKKALSRQPALATAQVVLEKTSGAKSAAIDTARRSLLHELDTPITSGSLDFKARRSLRELLDCLVPQ